MPTRTHTHIYSQKKIVCNRTGSTFNCDVKKGAQCYCTASNEERWGGGADAIAAVRAYDGSNSKKGVLVHGTRQSVHRLLSVVTPQLCH